MSSGGRILADALSFLVINVSRIGDTLLATPAIRAIARAYPGARIDALCHPKRADILKHLPSIRRVGAITKHTALARGWLPGRRYDYALVYGFDGALVHYGLRAAKKVVAFHQASETLDQRLHRAVEVPAFQSEHSVLQLLRLPAALGIEPAGLRLDYRVTQEERARAKGRLERDAPYGCRPLIGLQVASFPTKSYRDWPVESFAALCDRILGQWTRAHFLIYGGAEERARTSWLGERLGPRATLYAGLCLRETAAVMSLTDLFVGVDTGPTHMMSAFDVPLVGLYHCHAPSRLIGALDHPCFYPIDHPRPYPCATDVPMAEIPVETVLAGVLRALADHPPSATAS